MAGQPWSCRKKLGEPQCAVNSLCFACCLVRALRPSRRPEPICWTHLSACPATAPARKQNYRYPPRAPPLRPAARSRASKSNKEQRQVRAADRRTDAPDWITGANRCHLSRAHPLPPTWAHGQGCSHRSNKGPLMVSKVVPGKIAGVKGRTKPTGCGRDHDPRRDKGNNENAAHASLPACRPPPHGEASGGCDCRLKTLHD